MEVQAVDIHDVSCIFESLLDIAILENTIPNAVGAGFIVQKAFIFEGLLRINHRVE